MDVTVRPCASPADVAAIEQAMPSGPSQFHRRRFETPEATYLLAWRDAEPVGHALVLWESKYGDVRDELGRHPEVNALGVADEHRRQGVATALMDAACQLALERGHDRLGLAVSGDNLPAIRLYRQLGFTPDELDVLDVWSWRDERGVEHEVRDTCSYWTRALT